MIETIRTYSGSLNLIPSEIILHPERNIFSADSVCLLIGPNGSGKTKTLESIIYNLQATRERTEIDARALSNTYAIYYSPVPFKVDLPPAGEQFVNLQNKSIQKNKNPDFNLLRDVARTFNFDTNLTISFNRPDQVLSEIASYFYVNRRLDTESLPPVFREKLSELDTVRLRNHAIRREEKTDLALYLDSNYRREEQLLEAELTELFLKHLRTVAPPKWNSALAAINYAVRIHNKKSDIVQAILESYGIKFNRSLRRPVHSATQTYHDALKKLDEICEILGTADLPEKSYDINDDRIGELSRSDYRKFGEITLRGLSAGGYALINQFMQIEDAIRSRKLEKRKFENLLLLIDEGDVFLHLEWQQKYVAYLDQFISKIKNNHPIIKTVQLVLATHSPVLMSDFPRDCIIRLPGKRDQGPGHSDIEIVNRYSDNEIISFCAPLQSIIYRTGKAGTLGDFAAKFIKSLTEQINSGKRPLQYHLELIDDVAIKALLEEASSKLRNSNDY
jgi:Cdc6-like AAA superfamily ATPase